MYKVRIVLYSAQNVTYCLVCLSWSMHIKITVF